MAAAGRRQLPLSRRRPLVLPLIRSEFRKLTSLRSPRLLLAAGPLIVAAGITGLVESGGNVHDPATQRTALAHIGLAAILTLIFGILAVAGEYRHGTITDTFLSSPERGRVITAKLAVYALVGAVAGLVSAVVAVAVNLAFAAIGVGLGALVRNVVAAVAAALAWIALIEGIAGQLLGSGLARWMPFSASEALGGTSMLGSARLLPQWGGALVLLGYAAAFAVAAAVTTLNRDVT